MRKPSSLRLLPPSAYPDLTAAFFMSLAFAKVFSMHHRTHVAPSRPAARRAFTLLEMVIVIVIVSLLIGVGLSVGGRVVGSGKERSTRQVLLTLDQAMLAYTNIKGTKFPRAHVDAEGNEFPLADATVGASTTPLPSGLYAVATLMSEPASRVILETMPSEFSQRLPANSTVAVFVTGQAPQALQSNNTFANAALLEIRDAWGTPMRFVHPEYHGKFTNRQMQFRQDNVNVTVTLNRTETTTDAGLCPQNKPYFYSAGPDKRFDTREDNLYSVEPKFN
jgi:prepilin-type N-terminal cleavage/methylation domain-containing protein